MKKLLAILVALLVVPMAFATSVGSGIGLDITPEEFAPLIWLCDSRIVMDDALQGGRATGVSDEMVERINNYAFEGEQIAWEVLVMDKNKIEQIQEVVATIGAVQGTGNDIEVQCYESVSQWDTVLESCNARILEEDLGGEDIDPRTQRYFTCVFTVETPASMYDEHWITIEAIGSDGSATMDENEYWFLNPLIDLYVDGSLVFSDVRPGSVSYSSTLLVGNDADAGSGVLLDMFISGTDFYDPAASGALCPTTNHLKLSQDAREASELGAADGAGAHMALSCNVDEDDLDQDPAVIAGSSAAGVNGLGSDDNADHLCYYATNGAYSTFGEPNADAEGYKPIVYSDAFTRDFYNDAEIIANDDLVINTIVYDAGNVLSPGAEIALTFKLGLPEPCVGDFSEGDIYFWGEAV